MAEEKKGGDDSSFGVLEVIIGILLIVGLLDHLFGRNRIAEDRAPSARDRQEDVAAYDDEASRCGLSVFRPRSNEKVGNLVTVSGNAGECDWPVTDGTAVYAQVIDGKGKPVSAYTRIPTRNRYVGDTGFEATIMLTAKPATATGYVILLPSIQRDSGRTISVREPITF